MSLKRKLPWVVVVIVVALVGLDFFSGNGESPGRRSSAVPVEVVTVAESEVAELIQAVGTARALQSAEIASQVTGRVKAIHFADGQTVAKGDLLVEFADEMVEAELQELEARLQERQRNYERTKVLAETDGGIPASSIDKAFSDLEVARARVERTRAALVEHFIRAPFAGVVGFVSISPGAIVQSGETITSLDDISIIRADFTVPETLLARIEVGQSIEVQNAISPEKRFRGTVTSINPRINAMTRTAMIRAELENPQHLLRPGMMLTVSIFGNPHRAIVVPELALVPMSGRYFAYVLDSEGARVRQVEVEPGKRSNGQVEVLSGLSAGDRLVTKGAFRLHDGDQVKVLSQL